MTNKVLAQAIEINLADLLVQNVSLPAEASPGSELEVSYELSNQGLGAADTSYTYYYLSEDPTLSNDDRELDDRYTYSLNAGETSSYSETLSLPKDLTPGNYYLLIQADGYNNQVSESDEYNNLFAQAIEINLADLLVQNVSLLGEASPGTELEVSYELINQGLGAAGTSYTYYYLSEDPTLSEDDLELGYQDIYSLNAGETSPQSESLSLPEDLTPGKYYLLIQADGYNNQVSESNETNNLFAQVIEIIEPGVTRTLRVNTTDDENDGHGAIGTGLSLRDAIRIANANPANNYVIELEEGQTYTLTLDGSNENAALTGDLDITAGANVTIRAIGSEKATIDGNFLDRVFHVLDDATLTLENVTITGGLTTSFGGFGGGIVNYGNLEIRNTKITGNETSERHGGGISNHSKLSISDSEISGNFAKKGYGGGIHSNAGDVTIEGSSINNNEAEYGGGIHQDWIDDSERVTFTNVEIKNNTAKRGGGAVYNQGNITIIDGNISGNNTEAQGGAFYNDRFGDIAVFYSRISDNIAGEEGGVLYNNHGDRVEFTIVNSLVENNSAGGSGGVAYNKSYFHFATETRPAAILTAIGNTFTGNRSGGSGGVFDNHGVLRSISNTYDENSAYVNGGAISNAGGSFLALPCTDLIFDTCGYTDVEAATLISVNDTITDNRADSDGDGSGDGGGVYNNTTQANPDPRIDFLAGAANIFNGIIFGNQDNSPGEKHPDLSGSFNIDYTLIGDPSGASGFGSHSILNQNPLLGTLQDNGGPAPTRNLQPGSSAIDAGNSDLVLPDIFDLDGDGDTQEPWSLDQNGNPRIFGNSVDLGPVEFQNQNIPTYPVNLSITPTAGTEVDGTEFTITVTADSTVTGNQTVDLTLSGDADNNDFTEAIPSQITIPDGQTSGSVTVTLQDDTDEEGPETATFTISNLSPGLTLGNTTSVDVTIADDDSTPVTTVVNLGTLGNDLFNLLDSTNEELVFAGKGNDSIDASAANTPQVDRFYGGFDNDELFAGTNDRLFGSNGDDFLYALTGDGNRLFGGQGDDTLTVGTGDNLMVGGVGADTFVIESTDGGTAPLANTVLGFEDQLDKLNITDLVIDGQSVSFNDLVIAPDGGNTTISFRDNLLLTLIGNDFDITAEDFVALV